MEKLLLKNNRAFAWHHDKGVYVKGYLFDRAGNYFEDSSLPGYFADIDTLMDLKERVKYASGCFAVIIRLENTTLAATDMIRSLPLFYAGSGAQRIISDEAGSLLEYVDCTTHDEINREFLATGYVTGRETLIEGIYQVEAGQVIRFTPDEVTREFYYTYRVNDESEEEYNDLKEVGIRLFNKAFEKLTISLKGKTAVVPLSGGYDSRLIAAMLRRLNYPRVICFTYGRSSSPEIPISREVAEKLGFEWHFIEYTDELIQDYIGDEDFRNYYPYASNLVSMFFMQEYFAVRELKKRKIVPDDAVFIPGHSGDFLGGSQLNKHGNLSMEETINEIAERIFRIKYCYKKPGGKNASRIQERIRKSLQEKYIREGDFAYSVHEDWDFKEKLAKFNFNSISTYTWFGYQFRLPYWDRDLVEFFRFLPLQAKINKYLYDDILSNEYFSEYDLNFTDELQADEKDLRKLKIKTRLKENLPEGIVRTFISKKDLLFYNEITSYFQRDLKESGKRARIHGNAYNSVIIQWYLHRVEELCRGHQA